MASIWSKFLNLAESSPERASETFSTGQRVESSDMLCANSFGQLRSCPVERPKLPNVCRKVQSLYLGIEREISINIYRLE